MTKRKAKDELPEGCRWEGRGKKRKLVCDDAPDARRASRRHADLTRIVGEPKRKAGTGFDLEAFELFSLGDDPGYGPARAPVYLDDEHRPRPDRPRRRCAGCGAWGSTALCANCTPAGADDFERDDDFDRRAGEDEARGDVARKAWADNAEDDEGFRGLATVPSGRAMPITFGAVPHAREHSRVDLSGGFVAFRGTKKRRRR